MSEKILVSCEKCGKRLIERTRNGLWRFLYGRSSKYSKDNKPAVDMLIHGSIQMRCLDRKCRHLNTLNMLPNSGGLQSDESESKSQDANSPSCKQNQRKE